MANNTSQDCPTHLQDRQAPATCNTPDRNTPPEHLPGTVLPDMGQEQTGLSATHRRLAMLPPATPHCHHHSHQTPRPPKSLRHPARPEPGLAPAVPQTRQANRSNRESHGRPLDSADHRQSDPQNAAQSLASAKADPPPERQGPATKKAQSTPVDDSLKPPRIP